MRILVVEDDLINRKIVLRMLERLGYQAEVAVDGAQAVEMLEDRTFDVVFMDIMMPIMDGMEATRHVRAARDVSDRPWIIALTANAMPADRIACFDAGVNDFVAKPIRIDIIRSALEAVPADVLRGPDRSDGPGTPVDLEAPSLDLEVLREFSRSMGEDDPSFMRELVKDFVRDAVTLCAVMETAGRAGDRPALRRAAHSLKASSAMFGATHLSDRCDHLERCIREGDLSDWAAQVAGIESDLDRVRSELRAAAA